MEVYTIERKSSYNNHKEIQYKLGEDDCWLCVSHALDKDGYPRLKVNRKDKRMGRYIYERFKEPIPKGMCILHTCDSPRCINPDHLWIGTDKENKQDAIQKRLIQKMITKRLLSILRENRRTKCGLTY